MKKLNVIIAGALAVLLLAACSNSSGGGVPVVVPSGGGSSGGSSSEAVTSSTKTASNITFAATAEDNGIRFSISALPTQHQGKNIWIEDVSQSWQGYRLNPKNWDHKAAWEGLYTRVTAGKVYKFTLYDGNGIEVALDPIKVSGGSGAFPSSYKNASVTLSWSGDTLLSNFQNYPLPQGVSTGTFSANFYAGNGLDNGIWDGKWISAESVADLTAPPTNFGVKNDLKTGLESHGLIAITSGQKIFVECWWQIPGTASEKFDYQTPHLFSNAVAWPE